MKATLNLWYNAKISKYPVYPQLKILGSWDPLKPGNEIITYWAAGRRFTVPLLRAALSWVTNSREADLDKNMKKVDIASKLLVSLEALLPDI